MKTFKTSYTRNPQYRLVSRTTSVLLTIIFFVLLLYNCHRYFFKYNSTFTSPSYTDTPFNWQIGKYIILTIVLSFLYIKNKYKVKQSWLFSTLLIVALFILVINILNTILYKEFFTDELEYLFFFFLLFPLAFINEDVLKYIIEKLDSVLLITSLFLVASNLFVISNFVLTGRLPALAYQGLIVRFGGLWDDPNGFGFICVFLFFWNYLRKNFLLASLLLFCIGSTLSISSIVVFLMSLIYWSKVTLGKMSKKMLVLITVISVAGFLFISTFLDRIINLLQYKIKSAESHATFKLYFSALPLLKGQLQFHETWIVSFFLNYFPVSIIILFFFIYFLITGFLKRDKDIIHYYIFIFIIGNLFIPLIYNFPLNFVFILFVILCVRKKTPSQTNSFT